jgi:hypothetical protein
MKLINGGGGVLVNEFGPDKVVLVRRGGETACPRSGLAILKNNQI